MNKYKNKKRVFCAFEVIMYTCYSLHCFFDFQPTFQYKKKYAKVMFSNDS